MILLNKDSFIVKTGQLWKLWIIFSLIFFEFLTLILMIWNFNNPNGYIFKLLKTNSLQLQTIFLALGLAVICSLFLLVKCPSCKRRPIYHIVSNSNANNWVRTVFEFENCPYCGFSLKDKKHHS